MSATQALTPAPLPSQPPTAELTKVGKGLSLYFQLKEAIGSMYPATYNHTCVPVGLTDLLPKKALDSCATKTGPLGRNLQDTLIGVDGLARAGGQLKL